MVAVERLRRRADFAALRKERRVESRCFTLQARERARPPVGMAAPLATGPRLGFTITKKTGTAVERNRMRRRLKEAVRRDRAIPFRADCDYVVIVRRAVLTEPFEQLQSALRRAVETAHGPRTASEGKKARRDQASR
jgi:ribonuclease P protein component